MCNLDVLEDEYHFWSVKLDIVTLSQNLSNVRIKK